MENKISVAFASIEKNIEQLIPLAIENETSKSFVSWGNDNAYPQYLYNLFNDVSTLKTIIMGTADYVCGNNVKCLVEGLEKEINKKGDTARELVGLCARDYLIYGGFCIQVIRNRVGGIAELYYLDFRNIRASKKRDLFYYSEEYGKKYARTNKTIVYHKFLPEATDVATSVIYVTNDKSKTYPTPRYSGALKACEIERLIDSYHLSSLENGFAGSYIFNFNNGIPSDEDKAEIEKSVNEKFAGASNAGRILLNFSNGKDNKLEVQKLETVDFGAKYEATAKRSREQIFVSFQAVPALFGLMTESKGFAQEEFEQAFKLYNRTVVKPVQTLIKDTFTKIFGNSVLEITPFSMDEVE
jgi:capsid portal protein